jgi:hypothetical protein
MNNASDGDDWVNTNLGTPFCPGRMGWCIPHDAKLVKKIKQAGKLAGTTKEVLLKSKTISTWTREHLAYLSGKWWAYDHN